MHPRPRISGHVALKSEHVMFREGRGRRFAFSEDPSAGRWAAEANRARSSPRRDRTAQQGRATGWERQMPRTKTEDGR